MKTNRIPLALLAVAVPACAWWMAGRPQSRPRDQLILSHKAHEELGVTCDDCHAGVAQATDLAVSFLPSEQTCMTCHTRENNCAQCHTQPESPGPRRAPPADLRFSHAQHVGALGQTCERCHAEARDSAEVPVARPTMAGCLTCHEHQAEYDQASCLGCHPSLRNAPLRAVAEFRHGDNWLSQHGLLARSQGQTCTQCHQEATCTQCHSSVAPGTPARLFPDQTQRLSLHRGDFLTTHAIDARADGDTCLRCHSNNSCESCHRASGLTAEGTDPRSPHPPGYAFRGGQAFHGRDARLQIETCAACHDRGGASNCVECHRSGGVGGNPHPAGWSDRYRRADIAGNKVCLTCHN